MMKKSIYISLVFIGLLSACTEDVEMKVSNISLSVTATSEAFEPLDGTATRTSENLYMTEFANGDQIGITVIKDGGIVDGVNNICFTYNASTKKLEAAAGSPSLYYYQDATYLAYYPYDAGMNDKMTEQEIIDAFTPQTDQSTYANYTKSDLMVATGTADRVAKTLSLPFTHKMALVSVSAVTDKFITSGGYEYTPGKGFPVNNLAETSITVGAQTLKPCSFTDGTFRVIVPPDAATQRVNIKYKWVDLTDYTDQTQQILIGGKYIHYHFKMPQSVPYIRNLQPGDFYFNDGRIVPGDVFALNDPENCIGIIYKTGVGSGDNITYYNGKLTEIHGYVLSVYCKNGGVSYGPDEDAGTSKSSSDYKGYFNTEKMKTAANAHGGLSTGRAGYPVAYYTTIVCETNYPAPGNTSGWYLPSAGQLSEAYNRRSVIEANFRKINSGNTLSGIIRTSSEKANDAHFAYVLDSGSTSTRYGKDASWYRAYSSLTF